MARDDDEVSDLEWLMLEIDRLPGCAATKGRMKDLLRSMAGRNLYLARRVLVRPDQVQAALSMLDSGLSVAHTRAALIESQVCRTRSAAYVLIQQALALRGERMAAEMGRAQADLFRLKIGGRDMVVDEAEAD